MRRIRVMNFSWVLLLGMVFSQATAVEKDSLTLEPNEYHFKEAMLITQLLENYHFRKRPLNDSVSSVILDNFIEELDPNKSYFYQSDIDIFENFRYQLDDALRSGNVKPAFFIYNTFNERFQERMEYAKADVFNYDFDYALKETYETDRENLPWAKSEKELNDTWRMIVKSQSLNLVLSKKDKEKIPEMLEKRYDRMINMVRKYNSDDVFQLFMNTVSESYDPHTNYFSKATSENFKINMSLSLEGIGASLGTDGDYTKVARIIPAGPADKSNLLKEDDRIIGVGQGEDEAIVDVIGWRLDDVVKLIRGKKGSIVRLEILKAETGISGKPSIIQLTRDKVKLEDQAAKKEIIPVVKDGKNMTLGVIKIPSFYLDYKGYQNGDPNYKSTTKDVRRILQELKEANVDGVVVDLRNNGGGSLMEAIDLTGLFIKNGPVVQVKSSDPNRPVEVGKDTTNVEVYDGPLTVMINRFSASASEIFSGAIQDYKRGVVVGETTFGKGTVQTVVDLGRYIPENEENIGQLKLTIQKFYRVTGSSTQHMGVAPDINLPSAFSAEDFGESSNANALPWDQIAGTDYVASNKVDKQMIAELEKAYAIRLSSDKKLKELVQDTEKLQERLSNTKISLNYKEREKEREEDEKIMKSREKLSGVIDAEEIKKKDNFPVDDQYLKEGLIILANMVNRNIG